MQAGDFKGLVQAAIDNDLAQVAYHLQEGLDPNYLHPEIMTNPLIEATRQGHVEVIEMLLENGADPKVTSQLGESAVTLARASSNSEVLRLLQTDHGYLSRFINFWKKSDS
ncbi:MAG: ankyrin repeat domain-containing protein [Bacteroidota bacterium]